MKLTTYFSVLLFLNVFNAPAQHKLFKLREDIVLEGVQFGGDAKWVDYDNDKDLDVIISGRVMSNVNFTKVYQNNNGKFTEIKELIPDACSGSEFQFGDLNGDGYQDCVISSTSSNRTVIFKNNGGKGFTEIATFKDANFIDVALGDFDNDQDLDLLLQGSPFLNNPTGEELNIAKLYENLGNFSFQEVRPLALQGFTLGSVAWVDYDNDKDLDIFSLGFVYSAFLRTVKKTVLTENKRKREFEAKTAFDFVGKSFGESQWADYNKDGWLDVILCGRADTYEGLSTKIYENQQGKSFKLLELEIPAASSVKWADFDNDKQLDFLLGSGQINDVEKEFAGIYFGKNNTFVRDTSLNLSILRTDIVGVGDYDNDGDIDFFLSGRGVENQAKLSTLIYENQLIPIVPKPLRIGEADTEKIVLQWDSLNRAAVSDDIVFSLEKSLDGSNFTTIESFKNLEKQQYTDKDVKENIAYSYRLKSTNQFGKVNYSNLVVASILITSFEDSNIANKIAIFPNPSTGIVSIESAMLLENHYQISLSDCLGRTVFNQHFAGNLHEYQIDLSNLSNGIYQLCILWEGKRVYKKVVKM